MKLMFSAFLLVLSILCTLHAQTDAVAVLPFSANDSVSGDFGTTISEHISSFIGMSGVVNLVDRSSVKDILTEIEFQSISGIVDQNGAVEAGKLIGAQNIIVGSYSFIDKKIKIQARIIDVSTGSVLGAAIQEGENFSSVMNDISIQLLKRLGVTVTLNDSYKKRKVAGISLVGVGAAAIGFGFFSHAKFLKIDEDSKKYHSQDEYKKLEQDGTLYKNSRIWGWAGGAALGSVGAILLITNNSEWQFNIDEKAKLSFNPVVGFDNFGAQMVISF